MRTFQEGVEALVKELEEFMGPLRTEKKEWAALRAKLVKSLTPWESVGRENEMVGRLAYTNANDIFLKMKR